MRAFVDAELMPHVHAWDEAGTYPPELHDKAYKVCGVWCVVCCV